MSNTKQIKVTRTITTTTSETCWVEVPDDYAKYGAADFNNLVDEFVGGEGPQIDEEVLDVLDTSPWEVTS